MGCTCEVGRVFRRRDCWGLGLGIVEEYEVYRVGFEVGGLGEREDRFFRTIIWRFIRVGLELVSFSFWKELVFRKGI